MEDKKESTLTTIEDTSLVSVLESTVEKYQSLIERTYSSYWNARTDLAKTIISLASGSIVLTVTFSGPLVGGVSKSRWNYLLFGSWLSFLLSIIFGVLCLWLSTRLKAAPIYLVTLPNQMHALANEVIDTKNYSKISEMVSTANKTLANAYGSDGWADRWLRLNIIAFLFALAALALFGWHRFAAYKSLDASGITQTHADNLSVMWLTAAASTQPLCGSISNHNLPMALQDYIVIFDVTQEGYRHWTFPAIGLILIAAGLLVLVYQHLRPARKFKRLHRVYPFIFIGLSLLWTLGSFGFTFGDYLILRNAVRNGRCKVVEGTVSNFVPMPREGHAMEHFIVNGHYYEYSDFRVTAGFNHTQSHGGPIAEGRRVRICDVGGQIARLEVAW